jgi:1L-myo-inositol 1-phosphate cytidylyltransferase / CDP-L-myo-inositol myo-inositolphosphotransferase
MIDKAIVLLPHRPKSLLHADQISPLVRVGGVTLLQRTLYNLQWAGIREGILLSYGAWPEAERLVRTDEKNRVFTWITLPDGPEGGQEEARLRSMLSEAFLLQFPGWIVDRNLIRGLLQGTQPGKTSPHPWVLLEPASPAPAGTGYVPPLALVSGANPELTRSLVGKARVEEIGKILLQDSGKEVRRVEGTALIRVERPEDRKGAEHLLLQSLIKPTESWLSRKFERKVSLALSRRLLNTAVTPNQISVVSIFMGLASALLFLPENPLFHVLGGLLLLFSSILDGCDGELARLRYQESRTGSWLDFLGDNLVHMAVFFCIGLGLYRQGEGLAYLLLGSAAAFSTGLAASSVFLRVILRSGSSVITFATPVRVEEMERASGKLRRQIDFADKISNRDFIYLILLLSIADRLWIFAWFSGLGSTFYLAYLLYLYKRMGILGGGTL